MTYFRSGEKYKTRKGTANEGQDFEKLMTANLTLTLTLDKKVVDFNIKSNVDDYGAFDDIVFEVDEGGHRKHYCMQLKYKDKNNRLLSDNFSADSGDFALKKYCNDFLEVLGKTNIPFTGILFARTGFDANKNTNKPVTFRNLFQYCIKTDDNSETSKFLKSLDENCTCYQFIIDDNANSSNNSFTADIQHYYKSFFENFVLCVTTTSNDDIKKGIKQTFERNFSQSSTFSNFLELVKNLSKQSFSLQKAKIRHGITLSVLYPHIIPANLPPQTHLTESKTLLNQAIVGNTVTHFHNIENSIDIEDKVTDKKTTDLYNLFKFDSFHNGRLQTMALWLKEECTLIVNYDASIQTAIQLSSDLKYIVIGEYSPSIEKLLKDTNSIRTLRDIKHHYSDTYKIILDTFKCQLQDKPINLETLIGLDAKILQIITINELYLMADDKLNIAKIDLELPNPYISPRHFTIQDNTNRTTKTITETDMITNESKVTIISGGPGMGKTTIAKHIVYISNSRLWTLFFNTRDLFSFLRDNRDNLEKFKSYLLEKQKQHLNHFEYLIFKIFFDNNAIRYVWDSVDEVEETNFKSIKSLIIQLQNDKTVHYITTRPHLRADLENKFRDISSNKSLTLAEINEDEQRSYVQRRLENLELAGEKLNETFSKIKSNIEDMSHSDILGIPLQIYMITELMLQKRLTPDNINNQDFTIDKLYEYFIEEKLKIYCKEKLDTKEMNDSQKAIIDEKISSYINFFKRISMQLYFNKNDLKGFDIKCDSKMLQDIKRHGDKTGFIIELDEISDHYAQAQFFHNSISEFFAAQFLSENFELMRGLQKMIFNAKFYNILFFFNLILARDCKAHIAILCNNWSLLDKCTEEEIKKSDKGGRNVLQIVNETRENSHLLERYGRTNKKITFDESSLYSTELIITNRNAMIYQIKMISHKVNVLTKDTLFNFDTCDYMMQTQCFLSIGIIAVELKDQVPFKNLKKFKNDIVAFCLIYDFCDILNVLEELPHIGFDSTFNLESDSTFNLESVLLYFKCVNWIKKLTLDKYLKCKINIDLFGSVDDWTEIYNDDCEVTSYLRQRARELIEFLITTIKKVSIINQKNIFGKNLFLSACQSAEPEVVNLLLKNGADIATMDHKGNTALHYACRCSFEVPNECPWKNNHLRMVKSLIDKGAKQQTVNKEKMTPLHYCLERSNFNLVEVLLETDTDINLVDNTNSTVLHYACRNKHTHVKMIKALLEKGADVNLSDKYGDTPLHLAASHCESEIVKYLIENKANCMATNKNNIKPVHNALLYGYQSEANMLLSNTADISGIDADGRSVLHYACQNFNSTVQTIETILNRGISVNCQDKANNTPLHFAVALCKTAVANYLIKNKADLSITNKKCVTPLHCALNRKIIDMELINLLLENNADVNVTDDKQRTILHYACTNKSSTVNLIELILKQGVSVNCQDVNKNTPLHFALNREIVDMELINLLLKNNADVNVTDAEQRTILHYACRNKSSTVNLIEIILKQGVSLNCQDVNNNTPLHFAVANCQSEIVEYLIKKKADLNITNNESVTPLHCALKRKIVDMKLINLLLKNNADVNVTDDKQRTILHYACRNEDSTVELIELILKQGVSVNCQDVNKNTPLHFALNREIVDMELINLLLKNNADVNVTDDKQRTILHYACRNEDSTVELIELILRQGASVNCQDVNKNTPLHFALNREIVDMELINLLLKNNADVNVTDAEQRTILHYACRNKSSTVNLIEIILKQGVSLNCQDVNNNTPLHFAVATCQPEIAEYLIKKKADINITNNECVTPLHCALKRKIVDMKLIKLLLKNNADVNVTDDKQRTILHYACRNEDSTVELIELILKQGVSVNCQDVNKNTPLHFAAANYQREIAEYLIENKADINSKNIKGSTALHSVLDCTNLNPFWSNMIFSDTIKMNMIECLLKNNADVNVTDDKQRTILHYACRNEYSTVELIELILKQGVSVNCQDVNKNTPLHFAAQNCQSEIVEYLIKKKADLNITNNESVTPLHCALKRKRIDMKLINLLLKNNADVNVTDDKQRTILHYACRNIYSTENLIELILKQGVSVNCQDVNRNTPLHFAAANYQREIAEYLIENKADINSKNIKGSTALHSVLDCTNLNPFWSNMIFADTIKMNMIECLLKNNADVNVTDDKQRTILHYACRNEYSTVELIELILKQGVSVNCQDVNKNTPLHFAAQNCQSEIVEYLIKKKADLNITNNESVTPLHCALKRKRIDMKLINLLLKNNADVNVTDDKQRTILHYACINKSSTVELIELILKQGVSVNCQDVNKNTPLHFAATSCEPEIAEYLIRKKADLNITNNDSVTPLHCALKREIIDMKLINLLLKNNADVNVTDADQRTILHYACRNKSSTVNLIEIILKQGVSVNCQDVNNNTPLHFAVANCQPEIAEYLIKKKADINITNNECVTPLHCALKRKIVDMKLIKLLLKNNADVNVTDDKQRTILHYACRNIYSTENLIELILKQGVSVNCQDVNRNTPLHFAAANYQREIAEYLIENKADINSKNIKGSTALHSVLDCTNLNPFWSNMIFSDTIKMNMIECLLKNNADVNVTDDKQRTILHYACRNEYSTVELIELILKQGVSVNCQDVNKNTPLHFAAQNCQSEIVEYLIKKKADLNITNNESVTPLHCALKRKRIDMKLINLLLKNNADVNVTDDKQRTILHYACRNIYSTENLIELILKQGVSVNCQDVNRNTPLHFAAANYQREIAEYLIENKADINSKNIKGSTALHSVLDCTNLNPFWSNMIFADTIKMNMIECLLKNNADVNVTDDKQRTILHYACRNEYSTVELIELILKQGVSVNCQDVNKNTPLHFAAQNCQSEIVEYLIKKKADLNITNNESVTPLHCALKRKRIDMKLINLLLKNNADVNVTDDKQRTILHYACINKSSTVELIELILKQGVSVNCQDVNKNTPLHFAATSCEPEIAEYLIRKKADLNITNNDSVTPLHCALKREIIDIELINFLLKNNADVNVTDDKQRTILHYACRNEDSTVELIELILKQGVSVNCQDVNKNTPLHFAAATYQREIAEYLIENKAEINSKNFKGSTALHSVLDNSFKYVYPISYHLFYSNLDNRIIMDMIKCLLKNNVDINATDDTGCNSLHYACSNPRINLQIIQLLLEKGVSVNCLNNENDTPLDLAKLHCEAEIVECLLGYRNIIDSTEYN